MEDDVFNAGMNGFLVGCIVSLILYFIIAVLFGGFSKRELEAVKRGKAQWVINTNTIQPEILFKWKE